MVGLSKTVILIFIPVIPEALAVMSGGSEKEEGEEKSGSAAGKKVSASKSVSSRSVNSPILFI
ncbi:hypothetical protein NSMM_180011 [Nitrosomonas mobilis]|uniref:Uncharacterized protein n=1 Tax=Nitrosomonas mobilis TaxID=51642 RepID=A0A1G5SB82_9PROT|nr:hypothetical protein NSMM_180011 [Nitrosomonas mobilis]